MFSTLNKVMAVMVLFVVTLAAVPLAFGDCCADGECCKPGSECCQNRHV